MKDPTACINLLASVLVPAWLIACMLGHLLDPRITIAVAAIGLGILAAATLSDFLRDLFCITGRAVAVGLAAGAVMIAATYVLFPIVCQLIPGTHGEVFRLYHKMHVPKASPLVIFVLIMIIIGEEILWRGVFLEAIQQRTGRGWAVVVASTIYGLAHLPLGSPLLAAVAIACGMYWSGLRMTTNSLLPSLIAHIVWDIAIVAHPLVK